MGELQEWHMGALFLPPTFHPDGLSVEMTSTLYKNLANLAPEIKECVDACNFITQSTRDQNTDSAVMRSPQLGILCVPPFQAGLGAAALLRLGSSLPAGDGELGADRAGDRQALLRGCRLAVHPGDAGHLSHGLPQRCAG